MNPTQLLNSASSAVLTVLTKAGAALSDVQLVQAFIVNAVQLAEQTGHDGATKLAAVLNATETYVNTALPGLKADWNALSVQVRNFVSGVVSLFNALGVFIKDVENAAAGAIHAVEGALSPAA